MADGAHERLFFHSSKWGSPQLCIIPASSYQTYMSEPWTWWTLMEYRWHAYEVNIATKKESAELEWLCVTLKMCPSSECNEQEMDRTGLMVCHALHWCERASMCLSVGWENTKNWVSLKCVFAHTQLSLCALCFQRTACCWAEINVPTWTACSAETKLFGVISFFFF